MRIHQAQNKIKTLDELAKLSAELKAQKKTVVTTNGVFDILHVGHVRYLQKAKELGDTLIVGVNSDTSVKKIKGDDRPINKERDRAEVVAALASVDYVVIFEETDPRNFLTKIQPNYHTKGADYNLDNLIERSVVEHNGGQIALIDLTEGYSTTNVLQKISKIDTAKK